MKKRWYRFVCILLLGLMVMGKAAFALEEQGLAHAIEHSEHSLPFGADHDARHHHDVGSVEDNEQKHLPLSEGEHRLLHAVCGIQAALTSIDVEYAPPAARYITITIPPAVEPRHMAIEPPLRPPRAHA